MKRLSHKAHLVDNNNTLSQCERRLRLVKFDYIAGGYEGVFVAGGGGGYTRSGSYWLLLSAHAGLHTIAATGQEDVKALAPFRNANCKAGGFICIGADDELRIVELCDQYRYDCEWPTRLIPTQSTVHLLDYVSHCNLFTVCTSTISKVSSIMQLSGEDKAVIPYKRDEYFVLPDRKHFSVQMYTFSWEVIEDAKLDLLDWEHVTSVQSVILKAGAHHQTTREYVAISTVNAYNEDVNARGRIIIFDVIDVVPEPGKPLSRYKLKVIQCKEEKGPVTALNSVSGYLIGAVGQKMFLWLLTDNELTGVAFIDTSTYVHTISVLNNLIITLDAVKGVSLMRFQEEFRVLSVVAKNRHKIDCTFADFVVNESKLNVAACDIHGNLFVYEYTPTKFIENNDSSSDQNKQIIQQQDNFVHAASTRSTQSPNDSVKYLYTVAEFNTLSTVTKGLRVQMKNEPVPTHANIFTTSSGAILFLIPLKKKFHSRLLSLQSIFSHSIPHYCGLNPKEARSSTYVSQVNHEMQKTTCFLDTDLIKHFFDLSIQERAEAAKRVGASSDELRRNIIELIESPNIF